MRQKWTKGLLAPGVSTPRNHFGGSGRRQHLERRKDQIDAQIASINARDQVARRKRETRANIVLGAVIRSHAAQHPAFMPTLVDVLVAGVRRRADRELLASVLGLPQLVGGSDSSIPSQSEGNAPDANAQDIAPIRAGLRQHATEITARH
jgi:hypothetical protein